MCSVIHRPHETKHRPMCLRVHYCDHEIQSFKAVLKISKLCKQNTFIDNMPMGMFRFVFFTCEKALFKCVFQVQQHKMMKKKKFLKAEKNC